MRTKILFGFSPFELLYDKAPKYDDLKVFGCQCFPCIRDYNHDKLDPSIYGVCFFGLCHESKGVFLF